MDAYTLQDLFVYAALFFAAMHGFRSGFRP